MVFPATDDLDKNRGSQYSEPDSNLIIPNSFSPLCAKFLVLETEYGTANDPESRSVALYLTGGEYTGHLYVRTDYPQKPEFVIIVNGFIRDN